MRIFISHSSKDADTAKALETGLEQRGVEAWLDSSDLRYGGLLRKELQTGIQQGRALLLLWSKHARESRWVASEILTAFHLGRYIIPCRVDETPLPQFLANAVFPVLGSRLDAQLLDRVARSIIEAPDERNPLLPRMRSQGPELKQAVDTLITLQSEEMRLVGLRQLEDASEIHDLGSGLLEKVLPLFPLDTDVLNLAGYHHKNAYMIGHWDAIQAGAPPPDPMLERAERFFFDTLFIDPNDYSGLDGLGSVLLLERELEASEFFLLRAVEYARRAGIDYTAARKNLETVYRFMPGRQSDLRPDAVPVEQPHDDADPADDSDDAEAMARGHDAYVREDFAAALAHYDAVLANDPDSAEALTFRGLTLLRLDRTDEGFRSIDRAIELVPDHPVALTARGAALIGVGRIDEGLLDLDRALERNPRDPQIMYNKACGHALRGEIELAQTWLRRATERDPRYATMALEDPHLHSLRAASQ